MKSEKNNLLEALKKYWLPGGRAALMAFALFIIGNFKVLPGNWPNTAL